jgi:glycosyltransferase involved in cell wall biosynthesis
MTAATEHNREGLDDYAVRWRWAEGAASGFTAVLRVKNEARNMPWVLPGLLRSVDRVVVIDNESSDGTADAARRVAADHHLGDRLHITDYPFAVARCGSEHLHTPADSVHSLAWFYNWSFAHVETRYGLKWDGDMLLTVEGEQVLRDLAWQLEGTDVVLPIPRIPVYVVSDDLAYLDVGFRHYEPCAWPNKPEYRFVKGFEWEVPVRPDDVPVTVFPTHICFEIKWLDADEFTNWTGQDFITSERAARKQRDWAVFHALRDGALPGGLVRVDRGDAPHVLEAVRRGRRTHWLEQAALATPVMTM